MYKSAHQFKPVYDKLGINLSKLGCVMLDLESNGESLLPSFVEPNDLYVSKNKERFWIDGDVSRNMHVTLLYGLLDEARSMEGDIEEVLRGWKLDAVEVNRIGCFDSPYPDEDYYCIVAEIVLSNALVEGHERLECLPHINTFPGYKAHATICYIRKDEALRNRIVRSLENRLLGSKILVKNELNLGGNK